MYVCMYVCTYVCIYVRMYVHYVCMYAQCVRYVCMKCNVSVYAVYVCVIYVCMYVMYVCRYKWFTSSRNEVRYLHSYCANRDASDKYVAHDRRDPRNSRRPLCFLDADI